MGQVPWETDSETERQRFAFRRLWGRALRTLVRK